MSVYKLWTATDGDGAAQLDISAPGVITGVQFMGWATLSADADSFEAEISFSSQSGFATNDTKSSIAGVRSEVELVTSGQVQNGINTYVGPMEVPVEAGERVYLHTATPTGAAAIRMSVYIYVRDRGRSPRRLRL